MFKNDLNLDILNDPVVKNSKIDNAQMSRSKIDYFISYKPRDPKMALYFKNILCPLVMTRFI